MIDLKNSSLLSFHLSLYGLHYMGDDPSAVAVIHTTDTSAAVRKAVNGVADIIFAAFVENGLVSRDHLMRQRLLSVNGREADLNLHCTVFNTKFYNNYLEAQNLVLGAGARSGDFMNEAMGGSTRTTTHEEHEEKEKVRTVNATELLRTFEKYEFGKFKATEVHLSDLSVMRKETNYYQAVGILRLAET